MKYHITTEYSLWILLFCILLGAIVSLILYYKNNRYNFSPKIKKILFIIRFISVLFISFLLLSPLVEHLSRRVEKPIIIIAQDNSTSICINKDSTYYRTEYIEELKKIIETLKEKYEVKTYSFGSSVRENTNFDFTEKLTDISLFLDELKSQYSNRNIGAFILASDGIYNKGRNPLYMTDFANFPIYSIALGDTTIYKDLLISGIKHNKTAYLGNKFPVEITLQAKKCKGDASKLTIKKENNTLYEKTFDFTTDIKTQSVFLELDADKTGLQHYSVSLEPLTNEITKANNYQSFYIDVSDQKQNILILYHSPDPDIATIKQALEQNENYKVTVFNVADFSEAVNSYNAIILHQLPSKIYPVKKIIESIKTSDIPVLFILGEQSDIAAFNFLKTGLQIINNNKSSINEAHPVIHSDFPLFTIDDDLIQFTEELPPLYAPFGNFKTSNSSNNLFDQKIGSVTTKYPLILFNEINKTRVGIICGTGIWKWKLMNYQKKQNHDIVNNLIRKIVQYISATADKGLFKISSNTNYNENENIEMNAEVYNKSHELINTPEVTLVIFNDENKKYPFTFNKTSNAYHLDAGIFPAGKYRYEGNVKIGDSIYTNKGIFNVIELNKESIVTTANHKLLYNIANNNNGKLFYPKQMELLLKEIQNREDIKPVSYTQKKYTDFINIFWVFVFILILISSEWFLRKWSGNY